MDLGPEQLRQAWEAGRGETVTALITGAVCTLLALGALCWCYYLWARGRDRRRRDKE